MSQHILIRLSSLLMLMLVSHAFGETYPGIVYQGGYPELVTTKLKGNLETQVAHLEFYPLPLHTKEPAEPVTPIRLSYNDIQKVSDVRIVSGRPMLKTAMWVGAVVLSPLTFGASFLPAIGFAGVKHNSYLVALEYKDDVNLFHTVNFQTANVKQQLKLKVDLEKSVYNYRKSLLKNAVTAPKQAVPPSSVVIVSPPQAVPPDRTPVSTL